MLRDYDTFLWSLEYDYYESEYYYESENFVLCDDFGLWNMFLMISSSTRIRLSLLSSWDRDEFNPEKTCS
jgi:hypothetical protein